MKADVGSMCMTTTVIRTECLAFGRLGALTEGCWASRSDGEPDAGP
jgi:hypothetical protein